MMCVHCQKRLAKRPRGLCWGCHSNLEIRALYPPKGAAGQYGSTGHTYHEPSEAELDAMIAEQMKPENLPRWWMKDAARLGGGMPDDE